VHWAHATCRDCGYDPTARFMSLETILQRIRDAFDHLSRRDFPPGGAWEAPGPRERPAASAASVSDAPRLNKAGFAEEALPWMDPVYRFALRLTHGDRDQSEDLVQETFLRAYRAWDSYEIGTNCKSWLFTICKNTHLRTKDRASERFEVSERVLDLDIESLGVQEVHEYAQGRGADAAVFDRMLDDRLVRAIDALQDDFRDVLVLSDLGDLHYDEIASVLDIPVGTVKSRLFRARRTLQKSLIDYAADAGLIQDASA
jgi:RNA polymerase sigma-70 factor, ECF subfamily